MSRKLRSVNTRFWDDPFIEQLSPDEKLLFLYLLTNPLTNLLGIYEITIKRIVFDTGLKDQTIRNGLQSFAKGSKAFFIDNFIILPNYLKNQNLNSNMKIGVEREFSLLPDQLKQRILENGSEGLGNDYQTIWNALQMIRKVEVEVEDEVKDESKLKSNKNVKILSVDEIYENIKKHYREVWIESMDKYKNEEAKENSDGEIMYRYKQICKFAEAISDFIVKNELVFVARMNNHFTLKGLIDNPQLVDVDTVTRHFLKIETSDAIKKKSSPSLKHTVLNYIANNW